MTGAEKLSEVRKCTTGVENVFDDDHVSVLDAAVDVLFDLDDARAAGCSVPATDLHEFKLAFSAKLPKHSREVTEKVNRTFEDSEENDRFPGIGNAGTDLLGELASFELNLFCRDEFFEPHWVE